MTMVAIVTAGALIYYIILGAQVGQARQRYGIEAPAITGHPIFERQFRVHQNTLEQLIVFVPALWMFAEYASMRIAVLLGILFIVGRVVYARGYVADPKQRSTGTILTMVANSVLLLGGLLGALVHAVR